MTPSILWNLAVLFPIFTFLLNNFVWAYVYAQRNRNRVNRAFLALTAVASVWLGTELLLYFPIATGWETFIYRVSSLSWIPFGFWYLNFANAITAHKRNIVLYLGIATSLVGIAVTVLTDRVIIGTSAYAWGVAPVCRLVYHLILSANTTIFTAYGLVLIIKKWRRTTDDAERKSLGLIVYGTVVAMSSIAILNVVLPGFCGIVDFPRYGSSALAVFLLLVFYAVTKYRFLSISLDKVAEEIFEDVRVGIVLIERDGTVHRCNRETIAMFGLSIVGRNAADLFVGHDIQGEFVNREIPIDDKNGKRIFALSSSNVTRSGWKLGTILMVQDITAQKNAEEILRQSRNDLEREVEKRTRQLRHAQKMEAIGTLAGAIAHDFNNNLAAILGFGNAALADLPMESPIRQDLDEVILAANRGRDMVHQIVTFARKEDKTDFKVSNLALLLNETVALLEVSTPSNVAVRMEISTLHASVLCSPTQISQVVMNLYINACHAVKGIEKGELSIMLENIQITETFANDTPFLKAGMYTRLVFRDNGTGIRQDHLPHIFDPFFTTKARGEGTGLGVASAQVIVHNHDGEITVMSEMGIGTTFSVYLPTQASEVHQSSLPLAAVSHDVIRGNEHILWVDDEQQMLRMGKRMLSQLGYRITTAMDGRKAIEIFNQDPRHFDVVITDYDMPGMTGTELARELSAIRKNVPIILLSGYGENITNAEIEAGGIRAFFDKPIPLEQFGKTLRDILDR